MSRFPIQSRTLAQVELRRFYKNYYKPWTAEQINLMRSADYFGVADAVIALDIQKPESAVRCKRSSMKLKKEIKDIRPHVSSRAPLSLFGIEFRKLLKDDSISEIAARAGICYSAIYGACTNNPKMTLSVKAINLIGEAMELGPRILARLLAAHAEDKRRYGKIYTK